MSQSELHLDALTIARAQRLAEEKNITVEEVFSKAIERFSSTPSPSVPVAKIIGAFSDQADLLDEIVEEAYQNRAQRPFRVPIE